MAISMKTKYDKYWDELRFKTETAPLQTATAIKTAKTATAKNRNRKNHKPLVEALRPIADDVDYAGFVFNAYGTDDRIYVYVYHNGAGVEDRFGDESTTNELFTQHIDKQFAKVYEIFEEQLFKSTTSEFVYKTGPLSTKVGEREAMEPNSTKALEQPHECVAPEPIIEVIPHSPPNKPSADEDSDSYMEVVCEEPHPTLATRKSPTPPSKKSHSPKKPSTPPTRAHMFKDIN
ncbi:hypothetical protein LXL04_015608 [Taraxacum kok-saghyz]